MPTRKIKDIDPCDKRFNPCRHPEHNPPGMMVYQPGEYEHECPSCHRVVRFTVFPKLWHAAPVSSTRRGARFVDGVGSEDVMILPKRSHDWSKQAFSKHNSGHYMGHDGTRESR